LGCQDEWELKWPELNMDMGNEKLKSPGDTPESSEPLIGPEENAAKLRKQVDALRRRVEALEEENTRLRKSQQGVEQLRHELQQHQFAAKMQAEDLKILKMAAIERDTFKARLQRLERENRKLNTRILELLRESAASGKGAPITKPKGQ